jgi:hypothetical protein
LEINQGCKAVEWSTQLGEQWRGTNGNVNRKKATGQSKAVQKYNIWLAGS